MTASPYPLRYAVESLRCRSLIRHHCDRHLQCNLKHEVGGPSLSPKTSSVVQDVVPGFLLTAARLYGAHAKPVAPPPPNMPARCWLFLSEYQSAISAHEDPWTCLLWAVTIHPVRHRQKHATPRRLPSSFCSPRCRWRYYRWRYSFLRMKCRRRSPERPRLWLLLCCVVPNRWLNSRIAENSPVSRCRPIHTLDLIR